MVFEVVWEWMRLWEMKKNEIIRKIVKIRKARCSPQGAPCTYYKPPSFGIPGREPPMPQLKVSNQVPNKEIFPTALRRVLVTSHPRQFATKKQGAFCKSLRKSSKSGFNFLGFSGLNHGGAEAEQPQTSHCWWMAMNHYERNDSRDFGITGVCSGRKRVDEYDKKNASHPGGDWLATVHGAKGLDGDLDKNCHESTDLYRLK